MKMVCLREVAMSSSVNLFIPYTLLPYYPMCGKSRSTLQCNDWMEFFLDRGRRVEQQGNKKIQLM